MGRCIVKLGSKYVEWSTFVDAPVTYGLTAEQLEVHIRHEHGENGIRQHAERMARVEATGTSWLGSQETAETFVLCNRAGPGEAELSYADLCALYDGGEYDASVIAAKEAAGEVAHG